HTDTSLTKTKIGAESDEYEKADLNNLMGFNGAQTSLAIPLYYLYTTISQDVYHVSNSDSTPNGNNNIFCGQLGWPCLTIDYSIIRAGDSILKQIGIVDGYKLNEQIEINQGGKEVQILNQLTDSGAVTDIKSILNIEEDGKISIIVGTLSFNKIIFIINQNATNVYIITGTTTSSGISIDNCLMKMINNIQGYSISTGLVELIGGILLINSIEIKDIIISDSPIVLINENARSVSIDNSQFDNIIRTTSDLTTKNGGTIEATIGGSSGQLTIQNTNFTLCISQQSQQAGGISLIVLNQRTVSISKTSFIQCESDQGSGINAQILSGGTLIIDGASSFVCCKARLDQGASLYSTISGTNSKLILEYELLFEGFIKDQDGIKQTQFGQGRGAYIELSNDGIIEINEILFNDCKGINGGGIKINCQSVLKQSFNGTQFTSCVADQNGGGLYCIINLGEIELNQVIMIGCSALNGGGICTQINNIGKLTIKEQSLFQECISELGKGGAIQIQQNGGTLNIEETTLKKCSALNGGAIYASILTMQEFLIDNGVYFEECEAFSTNELQGRGGAIYINLEQDAPYEFKIGIGTYLNLNKASKFGRDVFVYCKNIDDLEPDFRFLFDIFDDSCNKNNAIYGTEFMQIYSIHPEKLIDIDLLKFVEPYLNVSIYLSENSYLVADSIKLDKYQCSKCSTSPQPILQKHYSRTINAQSMFNQLKLNKLAFDEHLHSLDKTYILI
ncbi:MAG: hypothetical protein EZS28_020534, partial [Streblomastix strix]